MYTSENFTNVHTQRVAVTLNYNIVKTAIQLTSEGLTQARPMQSILIAEHYSYIANYFLSIACELQLSGSLI